MPTALMINDNDYSYLYYPDLNDNLIICSLCPHSCKLKTGQTGFCGVRHNTGKKIEDCFSAKLSGLAMDPIEKKPLYHFFPGEFILSAGFYGCNFKCPFCQNHSISQGAPKNFSSKPQIPVTPSELVKIALKEKSFAIAYTYSEPLIHFEYILESATLAREAGLKNVLVTNGFINALPAAELLPFIDAANVDLKCYTDEFYKKEIKGSLDPVKDFIAHAHNKIHLEVTTLVIPGKNDKKEEIESISKFISSLNPKIPLHLSAYHPAFNYSIPGTNRKTILELVDIAKQRLEFVYAGNI